MVSSGMTLTLRNIEHALKKTADNPEPRAVTAATETRVH
jgi:hypothetical protein